MKRLADPDPSGLTARRPGQALVAAGVTGAVIEVVLYFWPDQVPKDVFSNPFGQTGFAISQVLFFLHHAVLVYGVAAVARISWHYSLAGRIGGIVSTVGAALWAATELVAILFASDPTDEVNRGLVGSMFGIGCTLVGIGLIVVGIAALNHGSRRLGWAAICVGLGEFVVLTPGIVSNLDLLQHAATGTWLLLFAVLGAVLAGQRGAAPTMRADTPKSQIRL